MKKSLVALAALAVIGAASAQSTVTIGGQLDAGISSQKSTAGVSTTTQSGGYHGASRMFFAGSEDMGGGNKANFRLEMQPNMTNGAVNTTYLFNRGAWMGLSGGWGEVRLGRQGTAAIGLICTADQLGCYSGFSGGGVLFGGPSVATRWISANPNRGQSASSAGLAQSTAADYTRVVNGVTYLSTNMNGFTGQVQYAFGGAASNQANGNGSSLGLNASYAQGPMYVGFAYQTAAADATVNATGKQTTLAGTYDLGMAKLGGVYQAESASGAVNYTSARAWALTATFPMGAALPYVKVGQHKTNGVGAFGIVNGADSQVFNLGSQYSLSKRTKLYADYAVDNKGLPGKPTSLSAGIQHSF